MIEDQNVECKEWWKKIIQTKIGIKEARTQTARLEILTISKTYKAKEIDKTKMDTMIYECKKLQHHR